MAEVIIALGSNLNNPHQQLIRAKQFLAGLSENNKIIVSNIYRSEPVGPGLADYLNAAVLIETRLNPTELFEKLKQQEIKQGRRPGYQKWTDRPIDFDIISYNNLVVQTDNLIIPHAEYSNRLFVLMPLKDVSPQWKDPLNAQNIDSLIKAAPKIRISKTKLDW